MLPFLLAALPHLFGGGQPAPQPPALPVPGTTAIDQLARMNPYGNIA